MIEDRKRPLEGLDPSASDAGYWTRFHRTTMERARPELARRRERTVMTVGDVVVGWSRTVVPLAMAAAVASLMFLAADSPSPDGEPGARAADPVEEAELALDGIPMPAVLEFGDVDGEGLAVVAGDGF